MADGDPLDPLEQLACCSAATSHAAPDTYDESETVHDPRIEGLTATLVKRMSDESMDMKLWSSQRIRMAYEAEELRSKSFGMEVCFSSPPTRDSFPIFFYL